MSKVLASPTEKDLPTRAGNLSACNRDLKLGDNCDVCWRGIMLPPGGLAYYQKILEDPNPPKPHGHEKILCPRCGHWHRFSGTDVIFGYDEVKP